MVIMDSSVPGRVSRCRPAWRKCMISTIRLVSTIVFIGLSETNTIGYYGIRGNFKMLEVVFEHTERAWRYWLSRRSHKGHIRWQKFVESVHRKLPLPKPRIMHNI